ncbi:MAG: cytochrome o ubiquinol oxidase subunit III, partial [Pseudomonadota bacterium]|nr:cytochrome o ubiquinol oxidase subunit III [Pseudomonadota bacterium]
MTTMTTDVAANRNKHILSEHGHSDSVSNAVYGFWIYIMSDCVLFACVFATFAVMSHNYAGGPTGKDLFDLPYVFGETMLLLCSSVTY